MCCPTVPRCLLRSRLSQLRLLRTLHWSTSVQLQSLSNFSKSPLQRLSPPIPFCPSLLSVRSASLPLLFFRLPAILARPLVPSLLLLLPTSNHVLLSIPRDSMGRIRAICLILRGAISTTSGSTSARASDLLPITTVLPLLSRTRLSFTTSISITLGILISSLPSFLPTLSIIPTSFLVLWIRSIFHWIPILPTRLIL